MLDIGCFVAFNAFIVSIASFISKKKKTKKTSQIPIYAYTTYYGYVYVASDSDAFEF